MWTVYRILFSLFILGSSALLFGQVPDGKGVKDGFDIIPASPTASSLGQYGGVNVGLSSGTVNKTIDLYTFVQGSLQVPLQINYSSNGIRVNDNGGIIGTGWTANMGGVIRRTVLGEDDERNTTRLPSTFDPYGADQQTFNYVKGMISYNITASSYDGEPDIYSFNFGTYSGKFIFDQNNNVILLNYNGLKIRRISGTIFEIYTPDGVKYEFGDQVVENTYKMGSGCGRVFPNPTNTAFFLYKITHPDGSVINMSYEGIHYTYVTGVSESQTYRIDNIPQTVPCNSGAPDVSTNNCTSAMYTNTYLLTEINSNIGKVQLSYIDHNAKVGKILQNIKIYKTGSTSPIKQIGLSYLDHSAGASSLNPNLMVKASLPSRSFLTEVQFFDANGIADSKYKFAYQDMDKLTARYSNSQDYFGYNNGKSNSTLIPPSQNESFKQYFKYATANRGPDGQYVGAGMLSRIIYPTGGQDSLIYEPNTVWKEYTIPGTSTFQRVDAQGVGNIGTGSNTSSVFTVPMQQRVKFEILCDITATDGPYPGTGRVILIRDGVVMSINSVQAYKTAVFEETLAPGVNYQVKVEAGKGSFVTASALFSYKLTPDVQSFKNQNSGGVRIQKVITKENGSVYEKKYSYHKVGDPDKKSTGSPTYDPIYEWHLRGSYRCSVESGVYYGEYEKHILQSNPFYSYDLYDSAPQYYSDVIEENSLDNSGTIYLFNQFPNARPILFRGQEFNAPWTSNANLNGLELDRLVYKYVDGQRIPVKRVSTSYNRDDRKSVTYRAYVVNERYQSIIDPSSDWEPLDLMGYDHNQGWIYPDTIRTKDYATNGVDFNETVEAFFYDNPTNALLSRHTILDGKSNRLVTHTLYPNDYAPGTSFIDNMASNYITGLPIESITYRDLGSVKSIVSGTINKYRPGGRGLIESRQALSSINPVPLNMFKFSNRSLGTQPPLGSPAIFSADTRYSDEIKILSYNSFNKLQELKKLENPTTVYLWGYMGQYPVMEIKNATYAEVATALTQAAIDNLNLVAQTEATMEALVKVAADKLRAGLPNALVTSYTYKPLVGMTSKTDARGIKETYTYDGMQRMRAILDHLNYVNKSIDYHYRPN
ncbi:hypothetical protein [Sphingobacterium sp. UME9]|uniref:hypothetical protein n=1 Tax=Sphingobacterium sp. UME9 TaxID=1862316 RepID=UPI0016046894|nr:hypothetical protein [Sphingobacterium sp. UME9]MBB1644874.1 hypothetical protein [Sphingobacterium sp. UME9]